MKRQRSKREKTLFRTLLSGIIGICVIDVAVLLAYLILHSTPVYLHKLSRQMENYAANVSGAVDDTLSAYAQVIEDITNDAELIDLVRAQGVAQTPDTYGILYRYRMRLNQNVTLHLLPPSRSYAISLGYNTHEYVIGDYAGIDQLLCRSAAPVIVPRHFVNTSGDHVALVIAGRIMDGDAPLGYVYLDIPDSDLRQQLQSSDRLRRASLSPYVDYFITTWYDYLVVENSSIQSVYEGYNQIKSAFTDDFKQADPVSRRGVEGDIEYLFTGCKSARTDLITICAVRLDYFLQENRKNVAPMLMLCLFIAAIGFVIAWRINREILSPINNILDTLRRFDAGDMQVRCHFDTNNELAQIRDQLNQLIMDVDQAMKNSQEKQEMLMLAENNILKAQIKPHFLNNVLESIYWMVRMNKIEEACTALTSMGKITAARTKFNTEFFETISDSIDLTQRYITLQQLCYPDKFDVSIEISPEDAMVMIPVFLLQPLVENAIVHGLQPRRGHGTLRISAHRGGEYLYLQIEDDGVGMEPEALAQAFEPNYKNHGIALYNIYRRIQLHYGGEGGMEIQSEVGRGTRVTIQIPLKGEQKGLCSR